MMNMDIKVGLTEAAVEKSEERATYFSDIL